MKNGLPCDVYVLCLLLWTFLCSALVLCVTLIIEDLTSA
jgi:hypothetical protein